MKTCYTITLMILVSGIALYGQVELDDGFAPNSQPVFKVDYPSPTADKPQSKIWCSDGYWWAIIPRLSGPSLWQRTIDGWKEHTIVNESLKGIPGRADVWDEEGKVTAVSVGGDKLVVFRLQGDKLNNERNWRAKVLDSLTLPCRETCNIETATIAKDARGEWWIAADINEAIYIWNSGSDGNDWSQPVKLASGLKTDDICAITVLPQGVGVIWSNQANESVNMRTHTNGHEMSDWGETEIIDSGNSTADDHLNTTLSRDGTLWLVSKNSRDELGKAQLVLHVRLPGGKWNNYPYAILDAIWKPSRPIIQSTDEHSIFAGHTIYNSKTAALGKIVFGKIDTAKTEILVYPVAVIKPNATDWSKSVRINDPTGPKRPYPKDLPWIILASDREGYIYEADLSKMKIGLKN